MFFHIILWGITYGLFLVSLPHLFSSNISLARHAEFLGTKNLFLARSMLLLVALFAMAFLGFTCVSTWTAANDGVILDLFAYLPPRIIEPEWTVDWLVEKSIAILAVVAPSALLVAVLWFRMSGLELAVAEESVTGQPDANFSGPKERFYSIWLAFVLMGLVTILFRGCQSSLPYADLGGYLPGGILVVLIVSLNTMLFREALAWRGKLVLKAKLWQLSHCVLIYGLAAYMLWVCYCFWLAAHLLGIRKKELTRDIPMIEWKTSQRQDQPLSWQTLSNLVILIDRERVSSYHWDVPQERRARTIKNADIVISFKNTEVPSKVLVNTRFNYGRHPMVPCIIVEVLDTRRQILACAEFSNAYEGKDTYLDSAEPKLIKALNVHRSGWSSPYSPEKHLFELLFGSPKGKPRSEY